MGSQLSLELGRKERDAALGLLERTRGKEGERDVQEA